MKPEGVEIVGHRAYTSKSQEADHEDHSHQRRAVSDNCQPSITGVRSRRRASFGPYFESSAHQWAARRGSWRRSAHVQERTGGTPICSLFSEFAGPRFAFRALPLRWSQCALRAGWLPTSGLYLDRRPLSPVEKLLCSRRGLKPIRQQTAALRDFNPAFVRFGSDSVIRRCRLRCPVWPKADAAWAIYEYAPLDSHTVTATGVQLSALTLTNHDVSGGQGNAFGLGAANSVVDIGIVVRALETSFPLTHWTPTVRTLP